jgi:starvation-inducible DNA-binding protein
MSQAMNIGIDEKDRQEIANGLSRLLADTFTLYLNTHKFHWNVTGPLFQTLHSMFETEYQQLWEAVDVIAERIRALGVYAPGGYSDFAKLTSVHEAEGVPSAHDMIGQLVDGHETVIRTARVLIPSVDKVNDEATLDLLTERTREHEKTAWMLRSLLDQQPSMTI